MAAPAKPKWTRRKEARPGDIVAAALAVFAEKGFAGAKMEEIASRAGLSKGALYLYFDTKEAVFRAVVQQAVAPNIEAVAKHVVESNLPFADCVRALLGRLAALVAEKPVGAVAKMVIGESRNFPELAKVWHDVVLSKAIGTLTGLIERAQQRGEVRPGDPRLQAFSLMGAMMMGVIWHETLEPVGGTPLDVETLAKQHAETVLAGLLTEDAR